ncbi:MAG: c-type cytochrome, partial [Anaerolineae bacterium]|nr:c-type cytochrome [Anaerolineae bacterium]
ARLRDNRMPPGWEFDIEETNRDGPMVQAGVVVNDEAVVPVNGEVEAMPDTIVLAAEAPEPPPLPDPIVSETIQQANYSIMFLVLFGGITLVFGIGMAFVFGNQLSKPKDNVSKTVDALALLFAILAVITAALLLHGLETGTFTKTVTITIDSPFPVEVAPVIPAVAEVRVEEWQAEIPKAYADLENPYADDLEAAQLGQMVFDAHDCYECHGEKLQGDGQFSAGLMPKPINLTDPQLMNLPFMTDTYLFWRISEGGSHAPFLSAMPAWKHTISEDARWQLVTFIRSQTANEAVDEGEQAAIAIIEKSGCFACHRLEHIGRGGKIGPPWSELPEVASTRQDGLSAADYVRMSIIDPAGFIVPGYEEASAMPPDFAEKLSEEEIDLLVEYLLNLPDD